MESHTPGDTGNYAPNAAPTFNPGDDVLLCDALHGWENVRARVARVVTIAPLSDSTARYLYVVDLDQGLDGCPVASVAADEQALRLPASSPN